MFLRLPSAFILTLKKKVGTDLKSIVPVEVSVNSVNKKCEI